jgi:DNA-binding response OmpR family regulator
VQKAKKQHGHQPYPIILLTAKGTVADELTG